MPDESEDFDALVRRVDPDRWLSTRFVADPGKRADLLVLQAFDHELGRALEVTSTPLLAEIRVTWWDEVLDEIFGGRTVRRHPLAQALDQVVKRRSLQRAPLEALVEGRIAWINAQAPEEFAQAGDISGAGYTCAAIGILDPAATPEMLNAATHAHIDPIKARLVSADAFPVLLPLVSRTTDNPVLKRLKLVWAVATGRL